VSVVLAISLLANLIMGVILFRGAHITKTDDRYGSYSMVYPLLNQAIENADSAAQGEDISANLLTVHTNIYWAAGTLRGLQYDGRQQGVDFSALYNLLDEGWLGFPVIHDGKYSSAEMHQIQRADKRLHQLVAVLKDTSFKTGDISQLRSAIEKVKSLRAAWESEQ
jgi:hypothetical protein